METYWPLDYNHQQLQCLVAMVALRPQQQAMHASVLAPEHP